MTYPADTGMVALTLKGDWITPRDVVVGACRKLEAFSKNALATELDIHYTTAERYIDALVDEGVLEKKGSVWIFVEGE